ncbi:MAG: hypothetical protein IAE96_08480 [Chitinophagaceae bacterium]|nr:hypothetical protein [Chitinophagaceae bacterium]
MPPSITSFSPHLFWDIKQGTLDPLKHRRLIVERVIQRGGLEDLALLQQVYKKEEIQDEIRKISWLNEKDQAFVHVYFDIPYKELKCYTKKPSARYY